MDRSQSEAQLERPTNFEVNQTEKTVNKLESQLLRHESPFAGENETNEEPKEDIKTVSSVTNNANLNLKIVEKVIRPKKQGEESSGKGDREAYSSSQDVKSQTK